MANTLTFEQISTVLNDVVKQATGVNTMKAVDTSSFVAQAQTALLAGNDRIMNSISQVLDRTIFSVRPYNAKFKGLRKNKQQWGNHVRKLAMLDDDFEDDQRQPLTDGSAIDMYSIKKGKVLQTNFYGGQVFQKHRTYFRDQLDQAFRSPDEFGQFISMYTQNTIDMIEQAHESMARACVANMIVAKQVWQGKVDVKTSGYTGKHVIKLLTMYNAETGNTLTAETLRQGDNFIKFYPWACAKIMTYMDMFTERSGEYQCNITDKPVMRHTPYRNQNLLLYSPDLHTVDTTVLSNTFHDQYLKIASNEKVNYWQNIGTPSGVKVTPSVMTPAGKIEKGAETAVSNVFGVLYDEEAMGLTTINQWSSTTPFNSAGGYWNIYYHFTDRYWNDMTEKCLVFILE